MSGDGEHRGRRRRRSAWGRVPKWAWIAVGALPVLVAANIVLGVGGVRDRFTGGTALAALVPDRLLDRVLFWVPVLVASAAVVGGLVATTRAIERHDRPSTRALRRAFAWAAAVPALYVFVVFDDTLRAREHFAIAVAVLLPIAFVPFARAALASDDARHSRGVRKRREDGSDEPQEQP